MEPLLVPEKVLKKQGISAVDKLVLSLIIQSHNKIWRFCFDDNYISENLNITLRKVGTSILKLKNRWFIKTKKRTSESFLVWTYREILLTNNI